MEKKPRKPGSTKADIEPGFRTANGIEAAPTIDSKDDKDDKGNVTDQPESGDLDARLPGSLPPSRVRDGEARGKAWERLRQEARTAGARRRDAVIYAGREIDRLWPLPDPIAVEPEPEPELEPEPEPELEPEAVATDQVPADSGVSGLGRIPDRWPQLPSNASLQSEIAWVQASRLDVVEEGLNGSTVVDLALADTPAPSKAAIGWLETSIRAYSKYCDIAAKATAQQEHEAEAVRRERLALADVLGLLGDANRSM
jgi:hypothetical protein